MSTASRVSFGSTYARDGDVVAVLRDLAVLDESGEVVGRRRVR